MSNDLRIVLTDKATEAHDQMLEQVRADGKTTISSSRLINWIVVDYFERFFTKRKMKLCQEHYNPRKCVLEAMKTNNPEEIRRALQEAARNLVPKKGVQKKLKRVELQEKKNDTE